MDGYPPTQSYIISFPGDDHIKPWNIIVQNSRKVFQQKERIRIRNEIYEIVDVTHDINVQDSFFDLNMQKTFDHFIETVVYVKFVEEAR